MKYAAGGVCGLPSCKDCDSSSRRAESGELSRVMVVVDATVPDTNLREYAGDPPTDHLQRILWNTGRANITRVWVDGVTVRG